MALTYYAMSARAGEKVESSVKDFASVLHQCGKTAEAVSFLERFKEVAITGNGEKYNNLLTNLKKQLVPTGKVFCKKLLLANIRISCTEEDVKQMFGNSSRVQ